MNQLQKDISIVLSWVYDISLSELDMNDLRAYERLSEYVKKDLGYETYDGKYYGEQSEKVEDGIYKLLELVSDEFANIISENDFTFSEELLVDTIGAMVNISLKKKLKELFVGE